MPKHKPIGNRHALSETDMSEQRSSGPNMLYQRLFVDRNALSETHQRLTCLIGDQYASSETNMPRQRPTCL